MKTKDIKNTLKNCLNATVKGDDELFHINEKVVDIFVKENKESIVSTLSDIVNYVNENNIDIHSFTFKELSDKINIDKIILNNFK
jgi:hypothetical protein